MIASDINSLDKTQFGLEYIPFLKQDNFLKLLVSPKFLSNI